jgi:Phosphotransferase enzyme family
VAARLVSVDAGLEQPLEGGETTAGVVRVGDTVRRPQAPNARFVHELLRYCEARKFEATPRFLGIDAEGREVLSFIEGWAPPNLEYGAWSYGQLAAAAQLLRRFHDLTAGGSLAGECEVVAHGDPSPVNFIWADGMPVGLIDFDVSAPGQRIDDIAYLCWLFVLAGGDDTGLAGLLGRAKRLRAICDAYALEHRSGLLDAVDRRQRQTRDGVARDPGKRDPERSQVVLEWIRDENEWLNRHRDELGSRL